MPADSKLCHSRPVIVIMAKAPQAGSVKTRLTPWLTAEQAAALAACFVQDTAAAAQKVCRNVLVAYTPLEEKERLASLLPPRLLWTPQRGNTLGERMQSAFEGAAAGGFSPLVMIGTDSPTLPLAFLYEALHTLTEDRADLVLGPTEDGGYCVIGVQRPVPGLLDRVEWSTERTLADTLRNAAAQSLRVAMLPLWYDIDTPEDLERLRAEFSSNPSLRERAPTTFCWLSGQAGSASQ